MQHCACINVFNRLKCNRQHPCDNCAKRDQGPSCHYDAERGDSINSTSELHDRLRSLEEKVQRLELQLTPEITRSDGRTSVDDHGGRSSHAPGVIFSGHGGTQYVDSGHWRAILNDVSGLCALSGLCVDTRRSRKSEKVVTTRQSHTPSTTWNGTTEVQSY